MKLAAGLPTPQLAAVAAICFALFVVVEVTVRRVGSPKLLALGKGAATHLHASIWELPAESGLAKPRVRLRAKLSLFGLTLVTALLAIALLANVPATN